MASWLRPGNPRVQAVEQDEEANTTWQMNSEENDNNDGFRYAGGAQRPRESWAELERRSREDDDVTLEEGGRHLVKSVSNWFIPRPGPPPSAADSPVNMPQSSSFSRHLEHAAAEDSERRREHEFHESDEDSWNPEFPPTATPPVGKPGIGPFAPRMPRSFDPMSKDPSFRSRSDSIKVDITFSTAEMNLKRDLKRQYLALAIGCWIFLTAVQSVSLILLNYWEYAPVVIALAIMAGSVVFYWRYVWGVLRLPFKRLWQTPYPFAAAAAVLGSLAQHAMFLIYEGYELGQLLIVFFLIQAFYFILVASTFRHYMSRWQRFLNHRKLCFDSLQSGVAKSERRQELLLVRD
mmetsp:Transcript_19983/g.39254  ORF Transcript_19983/g.39254 Transcript_19983/m.39254 type:complete len:349 (+) Transcript_19983:120-1166(+)